MFESVEKALNFLLSNNKISNEDYFALQKYYKDLIESNNYDVNVITNDLKGLFDGDYVDTILNRVNSQVNDKVETIDSQVDSLNNQEGLNNTNQVQEEKKTQLIQVYDFKREDKDYIKLSYSDGSIRIFENNLNNNGKSYTGEEIFSALKSKYGDADITNVFHQFVRNSIEIGLYDFRDLNNKKIYDELSRGEQQLIYIVMSKYPDKKVLSGASNNMFVVLEEGKPDLLVQVESLNGAYQVRQIVGNEELSLDSESLSSDNESSKSISYQKSLSTPVGRMLSDNRESGFVMLFLFIFLAGISSGIIFMIILNFIA